MRAAIFMYLIILINCFNAEVNAQQFLEKHAELGVRGFASGNYGNGISLYDWNEDGYDDLVLLCKDSLPAFYLNKVNGFERVYFDGITVANDIKSVVWADFNNDGMPDLSFNSFNGGLKLFVNNGDFTFKDITTSSGVYESSVDWGYGISWADYNSDSYLDLFVANYNFDNGELGPNHLYKNNGDLTFTDVTLSAGLNDLNEPTFMGIWFDYNNDNKNDLFILNDRIPYQNYLYRNEGDGVFEDKSQNNGVMGFMDAMSGTVGDYNNDGRLDIYICNTPTSGNKLYRNYNDNAFVDVAGDLNLRVHQWCWGATWVDYNNDALQDLFVVSQPFFANNSVGNHYLYQNNNGTFDWQVSAGFAGSAGSTFSTARGDFNNDGHPDLVTHSFAPLGVEIWMNQIQTGNYLKVALQGVLSNRDGVGARITVHAGGIKQTRFTLCGEQFISQNSQWQHFGLASINTIDSLIVKWPSGFKDVFYNVNPNQSLKIIEGSSITNQITIVQGDVSLCPGDSIILDGGNWTSYQWSTGDTNRFISVNNEATISLLVKTPEGFDVAAQPITITRSEIPAFTVNSVNPSCFGMTNGSIEIQSDDINSLGIQWENGHVEFLNSDLSASTYYFTIKFGNECSLDDSTSLIAPSILKFDSISFILNDENNVDCANAYSLQALSTGGIEPYTYTWYLYNNTLENPYLIINNQDEICISPTEDGFVICYLIDANSCIDSLKMNLTGIVSLASLNIKPLIYPNPFEEKLFVQASRLINDIRLMDISGRYLPLTTLSENSNSLEINTTDLASGIYFIRINSDNNWYNYKVQKK